MNRLTSSQVQSPPLDSAGRFTRQWMRWLLDTDAAVNGSGGFLSGLHAERKSAQNYAKGTIFYETDRNVVYLAVSGQWTYFYGTMRVTRVQQPRDLGASDAGFLLYVSDYAHLLAWTGTGWTWGPGESGSGFVQMFYGDPNPNVGWHRCDGSMVNLLGANGNVQAVAVPDEPITTLAGGTTLNNYFRQ